MMNPMQVDGHLTDRGYKEVRRKMDVTGHCTNLSLIASVDTFIDRINRYTQHVDRKHLGCMHLLYTKEGKKISL